MAKREPKPKKPQAKAASVIDAVNERFQRGEGLGDPLENITLTGDGVAGGVPEPTGAAQVLAVPMTPNPLGQPAPIPPGTPLALLNIFGKGPASKFANASGWQGNIGSDAKKLFDMGMIPRMSYATQGSGSGYMRDFQVYLLLDEMADRMTVIAKAERMVELKLRSLARRFQFRGEILPGEEKTAAEIIEFLEWVMRGGDLLRDDSTAGLYSWQACEDCMAIGTMRHGYAVMENVWEADGGKWRQYISQFRHGHPGYYYYDANGYLILGSAYGDLAWKPAPPLKFMIARETGLYSTPFGDSVVWKCRWLYQWWKYAVEGWVDWCTLFGTPLLLITYPPTEIDKVDWGTKAAEALKNISEEAGIAMPEGVKIEAVGRTGSSGGTTPNQALIEWLESLITSLILMGELNTSQSTNGRGSEAMGRVHQDNTDMIVAGYARIVEAAMLRGAIIPMVLANFGPEWARRIEYVIDTETARDVAQSIAVIDAAGKNGIPMAVSQAQEWLGIEDPKPEDELIKPAPVAAPFGMGGGMDARTTPDDNQPDPTRTPPMPKNTGDNPASEKAGATEDGITPFDDGGAALFAEKETNAQAKARAQRTSEKLQTIADLSMPEIAAVIAVEVGKAAERIAAGMPLDEAVSMAAADIAAFNIPPEVLADALTLPVSAGEVQSLLSGYKSAVFQKPSLAKLAIDPGVIDPHYRAAYDWMLSREIATKGQLQDLANAQSIFEGRSASQIETELRRKTLALADKTSPLLTEKFQAAIAGKVGTGATVNSTVADLRALADAGEIPPVMDSYMRMVTRTETANAYSEQGRQNLEAPEIQDFVWGLELTNARLPSSRPSHVAIQGMRIQKGSAAWDYFWDEMGGTPFSYNCTCLWFTLVDPDGAQSTEFEETPGALETLKAVVGFE